MNDRTVDFSWKDRVVNKIRPSDACRELMSLLDKYDWFYDCRTNDTQIFVYVNYMTRDVFTMVPTILYGYSVMVHYAQYLNCGEKYAAIEPNNALIDELLNCGF
jgi:hypothetical protein